ncbi:hypothetical protein HDU93_008652 [Gonapodya sp. JEL0774]|nr:hypothetical protein HDU93_008652 [Gonapodya sp. JEL0774]
MATFLQSTAALLDRVDEVRKLCVGRLIELPQIAVVGDQSSGKSSLLEAISGVTFPKGKEMCTTFATQIVMGPAEEFTSAVSIVHGNSEAPVNLPPPKSEEDVQQVISKAKEMLSAYTNSTNVGVGVVADKLLSVELRGPKYPRLTLVDLPGYVHSAIKGQSITIKEDIEKIVDPYLQNERTIILAVIPANKDLATNVVVDKVEKLGNNGARTLGVITKCDTIDGGEVETVLKILRGERCDFKLGYHCVRNRNFSEVESDLPLTKLTEIEEQFFTLHPWSEVNENQRGVMELRERLVRILHGHVQQELPKVRSEVDRVIEKKEKELAKLGMEISTEQQRHVVLHESVAVFMEAYKSCATGRYAHSSDITEALFLRANIRNLDEKFHAEILKHVGQELDPTLAEKMIRDCRGYELPGFPPYHAFVQLANGSIQPWHDITKQHVEAICSAVLDTLRLIIQDTVHATLKRSFQACVENHVYSVQKSILEEVKEMFIDEMTPMTTSDHYTESLTKARSNGATINGTTVASAIHPIAPLLVTSRGTDFDIKDLIDRIKSYLATAAKKYVDAVCMYAVERRLFRVGMESLRKQLQLTDLREIEESSKVVAQRSKLNMDLEKLREARKKL